MWRVGALLVQPEAKSVREKKRNSNYRGDIKATHARAPSILTTKPLTIYYY